MSDKPKELDLATLAKASPEAKLLNNQFQIQVNRGQQIGISRYTMEYWPAIRARLVELYRLAEEYEWVDDGNHAFTCLKCGHTTCQTGYNLERSKKEYPNEFIHAPDCRLKKALEGK